MFGSTAWGEPHDSSDLDLLVVLADGDPADPWRTRLAISDTIGYEPPVDVLAALEQEVRKAARRLASVLRTASEEGSCSTATAGGRPTHPVHGRRRPPASAARTATRAGAKLDEADIWAGYEADAADRTKVQSRRSTLPWSLLSLEQEGQGPVGAIAVSGARRHQ